MNLYYTVTMPTILDLAGSFLTCKITHLKIVCENDVLQGWTCLYNMSM